MEPKELVGLYEAYQQVYEPQQLTEEVEIATEYFYEMGLNENGIDILIEELGEEEFIDWVYDIAEEYTLSEATRLQQRAAERNRILTGPKGSKPQSTTKAREKSQGGLTMRSSQRPGSTISGKREKAASTAVSQQEPTSSTPQQTRTGIAGRLGAALGGVVNKARSDIELVKKTGQTVAKAVRTGVEGLNTASDSRLARQARVQVKKGLKRQQKAIDVVAPAVGRAAGKAAAQVPAIVSTYKAGQRLGRALKREEYEYILEHLLDEGYANSIENAEKIAMNMSEDWRESIVEEMLNEGLGSAVRRFFGGKKETEAPKPSQGRTAQLRQKYGVTSRTGSESPRGRILTRMQQQIDADARKHGPESSAVQASTAAREQMLRGGYSQFGMNDSRRTRGPRTNMG